MGTKISVCTFASLLEPSAVKFWGRLKTDTYWNFLVRIDHPRFSWPSFLELISRYKKNACCPLLSSNLYTFYE